jgi:ketosteroid isomerase-like protein
VHAYTLKLTQGQILRIIANQRGVDVVVRAFAPDGTKLGEFDSPNGTQGPEKVTLFTEATGTYRFEIAPFGPSGGRYDVTVVELRAATKTEFEWHKVEKELLLQFERPWDDANRLMDTAALERLMADDYLNYSVTNRGANQDKQGHLDEAAQQKSAGQNVTVRHDTDDVTARVYNDSTAMVTGRVVITSTSNGREQRFPGRFVHVWLKRNGRWQIAGDMFFPADPMPVARTIVKVDPQIYDSYVGKYELEGTQLTLTKSGDNLLEQIGEFQDTLYPESDSEFFSKVLDVQFTFVRNAQGEITHLIMTQNGRASKLVKIREKRTQ